MDFEPALINYERKAYRFDFVRHSQYNGHIVNDKMALLNCKFISQSVYVCNLIKLSSSTLMFVCMYICIVFTHSTMDMYLNE